MVVTRATLPQSLVGSDLCAARDWPRTFDRLVKTIAELDPRGESCMQLRSNAVNLLATHCETGEVLISRLPKSDKSVFETYDRLHLGLKEEIEAEE